jgi:hypothetical protein
MGVRCKHWPWRWKKYVPSNRRKHCTHPCGVTLRVRPNLTVEWAPLLTSRNVPASHSVRRPTIIAKVSPGFSRSLQANNGTLSQSRLWSTRVWAERPINLGSIPGRAWDLFLRNVQTGSGPHPASSTTGTGESFPGAKAAGAWNDRSPPSSTEGKSGGIIRVCIFTPSYVFSSWCLCN